METPKINARKKNVLNLDFANKNGFKLKRKPVVSKHVYINNRNEWKCVLILKQPGMCKRCVFAVPKLFTPPPPLIVMESVGFLSIYF